MSTQDFVQAAAARLRHDGAQVSSVALSGGLALVGYQSQFRLTWMATKLHLFTVVADTPHVTRAALSSFANDTLEYADSMKGSFRGLQVGVATIAVLVGDTVEPDAAAYAEQELVRRFAGFCWPATVEVMNGRSWSHQGRVLVGGLYAGWMRDRTAVALGR